ncbi:MAG: DNA recombination protein RmuC [Actinobacteria bacterium]|nr:DNA recombination protein RmuC [Actinomycetota bacterium]
MPTVQIIIAVLVGLAAGLVLCVWIVRRHKADKDAIIQAGRDALPALLQQAVSSATDELLKHSKTQNEISAKNLDSKKALIDQTLQQMTTRLEAVKTLMQDLEKDRAQKFGEVAKHLQLAHEQTAVLTQTTNSLREALSGSRTRGQWGERMAEDVLRLAGFVENVNYTKQKTIESTRTRPDFTFFLPRGLKVNMDVKFPLDNYMRYLDAESDADRDRFCSTFLNDVKNQSKTLLSRDYVNPEQNTVDYVLMFIPNEQVYAFIHQQDSSIIDEAMKKKVIFCSPLTLFAILAVIRQAVDNFALEQASNEILSLLSQFNKQWGMFKEGLGRMGKRIDDAQKEFQALDSTRSRQLERPLEKIEQLRTDRHLPIADDVTPPALPHSNESA